jgi:hypothetical protein
VEVRLPLSRIPVLVRAGAVVPTQPSGKRTANAPARRLVLTAFPGVAGSGALYDDAGSGFGYRRGGFTRTAFTQRRVAGVTTLVIGQAHGTFPGALAAHGWDLRIKALGRPREVTLDGRTVRRAAAPGRPGWRYDAERREVRVVLSGVSTSRDAVVRVS